jgi:hypothetical protein
VSLALDGWMRQGQEREYKEYKEYKEFKEFKEYEESANAPLGSHGLVSPYPRVAVSPSASFAGAVAAHFAVKDLIRLRPFAKVLPSQASTANSLARLLANSVKNCNISRLKTCGLSKFAR